MADDIEDVSFLPGENLNRKSVYEPSTKQRCKQLVCSKGRATAIVVVVGLFILIITVLAAFARSGSATCEKHETSQSKTQQNTTKEDIYATNGDIFPWQNIRLPSTIIPISYAIFLNPDLKLFTFSGNVKILASVKESTSLIVLHTKNLTIDKIQVDSVGKRPMINIDKYLIFLKNEQLAILTGRILKAGEDILITVDFHADLVSKLSGFYLSTYKTKKGEVRHIGTTQFQATGARQAFPCFDEPAFKAKFKLSIVRDKNLIALFNMPKERTEDYSDGRVLDIFQESVKMSSYLVAFVVCDYKYKASQTKSGVNVTVYAAEDQIDQVDFALSSAVKVLDHYDKMYKIKYPLPKLDLIAIPDFSAGAMENWGLVTYREPAVLYHPGESSDTDREWVAIVVSHELAHQWFGNLVTLRWWDDTWLNEGFAKYIEHLGTNVVDPTLKMDEQFIGKTLQPALMYDGQKTSHPIQVHVENPNEVNEVFDTISYDKGASLIRMLQDFMGEDKFMSGITDYLNQYKYDNAVTNDLWNALSKKTENAVNVTKVMDSWTKQMGYPVITVKWNQNKFLLTQQRFLSDGSGGDPESAGYKWYVPFRYRMVFTDGTHKDGLVWLNKASAEIDIPKEISYIKGNLGMYGFYRVNYEESMWNSIIQQLQTDHTVFTPQDRAGLLDDVFYLARAGLMKYTTALDLTKYLKKEVDYTPWYTALDGLGFIEKQLEDSLVYDQYRTYTLGLIKHLLETLEWEDSGDPLKKFLRINIFNEGIALGDTETAEMGRKLYDDWMLKNTSIPPNLKRPVFKAGIKYGGLKEWKFMLDKYNKTMTPSSKSKYLRMLGETKDGILLNRLLQMALNENLIKHTDMYKVISTLSRNPSGKLLTWRFLQRNWDKLLAWFTDVAFSLPSLVKTATAEFSTEFDFNEVDRFFKSVDVGPAKRAVSTALENIRTNINWLKSHEKEVTGWLQKNVI